MDEPSDTMSTRLTTLARDSESETVLKEPESPHFAFKLNGPGWQTVLREAWGECVAVIFLVAICCGTACYGSQFGGGVGYVAAGLVVPATISALVASFGVVSGAHLNPVMSLAFWLSPSVDFSLVELIAYIVAQLIGAIVGAGFCRLAVPKSLLVDAEGDYYLGQTLLPSATGAGTAVFAEALCTGILVLIALLVVPQNNANRDRYARAAGASAVKRGYKPRVLSPMAASTNFAFYAVMSAIVLFCGPITGGSFNPARSFGPVVIGGRWSYHWVYWVGPTLGSVVAVLLSLTLRPMTTVIPDLIPATYDEDSVSVAVPSSSTSSIFKS